MQKQRFAKVVDPFDGMNLDDVPPQEELENIWMYMNFHLNF